MTGGRRPTMVRALGTAAAGAVLSVALASCSSPKANGPTTTTTSGGATSSSSTSSAASSTTSVPPGTACDAHVLIIAVAGSEGAAGTNEVTFSLRNTSGSACPLKGYPGAQLLSSTGAQLPTHVVPGGGYPFTNFAVEPVTLAPGQSAYFNAGYSDVPHAGESNCPTATQVAITPPGASDSDLVTVQFQVCNMGTLTVSPVFVSGGPGSETTAPPKS